MASFNLYLFQDISGDSVSSKLEPKHWYKTTNTCQVVNASDFTAAIHVAMDSYVTSDS